MRIGAAPLLDPPLLPPLVDDVSSPPPQPPTTRAARSTASTADAPPALLRPVLARATRVGPPGSLLSYTLSPFAAPRETPDFPSYAPACHSVCNAACCHGRGEPSSALGQPRARRDRSERRPAGARHVRPRARRHRPRGAAPKPAARRGRARRAAGREPDARAGDSPAAPA